MRLFAILLFILALGLPAAADVGAPAIAAPDGVGRCVPYAICANQTVTGICDSVGDGSGENLSIQFYRRVALKLMTYRSTATTYSCALTEADAVDLDTAGSNRGNFGTPVTDSAESVALSDLFMTVGVECTAVSGGGATVHATLLVCEEEK